jgi:hypothetical protein
MSRQVSNWPGESKGGRGARPGEEFDLMSGPVNGTLARPQKAPVSDHGKQNKSKQQGPGGCVKIPPKWINPADSAHRSPR